MTDYPDPAGVDVRRGEIDAGGTTHDGWVAAFDGTEAVGISREDALKRLVTAVAQEGQL
ncbi:hypothetical protein [Natrinema saccharevitans]|uniref:hypothetical protein n=1 Tax=Natrinema saccharevitans TaxID=301967 RepID=UPI00158C2551|nr:hypothetical protein [Natrinema saccharevitans]